MKTDFSNFFRKGINKFIALLLGAMGFSAGCIPRMEYGVPSADFIISGEVNSTKTEQPIENIKVSAEGYETYTDADGNFSITINTFPDPQDFVVSFKDIDSTENGYYQDIDTTISFDGENFTDGDGSWYSGYTEKNISIDLDDKE